MKWSERKISYEAELTATELALTEGRCETAYPKAASLLAERPSNFKTRRVAAELAAALGKTAELRKILDDARSLFPPDRLRVLARKVVERCNEQNLFELGAELIGTFEIADCSRYELFTLLIDSAARKQNHKKFEELIGKLPDQYEAASLRAMFLLRLYETAAAKAVIAGISRDHPVRRPTVLAAFKVAEKLHAEADEYLYGMELVEHYVAAGRGEAADINVEHMTTACQTMKVAAKLGYQEGVGEIFRALKIAFAKIRSDDAVFAKHWRPLVKNDFELFCIEDAEADLQRVAADPVLGQRLDLYGQQEFGRFIAENRAELAWTKQAIDDILMGNRARFPANEAVRIVFPNPKMINLGKQNTLGTDLTWLAVVSNAMLQAREVGGVACIMPDWLSERAAALKQPPVTLSYHTHGKADKRQRIVHFKEADLPHFVSIDTAGYAGWSSLAGRRPEELQLDRYTSEVVTNFNADFMVRAALGNISKYSQPERSEAASFPPAFVFVALQIPTDRVQALARVPMIEMLNIVVRRFHGTDIKVLVKRHPLCRDVRVSDALGELQRQGLIDLRYDSIHDLISRSLAVITTNSGVGSEAILHLKPIYMFGRGDYAAVAHSVHDEADFIEKTSPIRLPVPVETMQRFLVFYRRNFLVDVRNEQRLSKIIRRRVIEYGMASLVPA